MFHPKLPIIASASEDGTVRIWQSTTYRAETTLNYGMERAWALAASPDSNKLAIGFDEGCVCIELGSDDPVASMDATGKVVWARNNEIMTTSVRGVAGSGEDVVPDGERLAVVPRDLGACELFPQMLRHNCNGRFISVCGDGEFIIYTSQALRNKAFGQALDFVWSGSGTGDYAIRETVNRVKVFKNFNEAQTIIPATAAAEGLFGGQMIGVKSGDGSVLFYDWDSGIFVRKIDAEAKDVYWSDSGNMVLLACADSAFVLSFNNEVTQQSLASGQYTAEDGVDGSFDLLYEISDTITSGKWVGDCFIYVNNVGRLNYSVGGQIETLVHLETNSGGATQHSILGYLAKEDRVFLIDKSLNVVSYKVTLAVLQYQTAVMRGDFDSANELLPSIPDTEYTKVARFLESQGFKEEALAVTQDSDHKFDLAIELGQVELAHQIVLETPEEDKDSTDTHAKWKRISDAALKDTNLALCESASISSNDFPGLLLLYSSTGNLAGMERLAKLATENNKTNVAFVAHLLTGNVEACADLLIATKRLPEAAFFVRTYLPSRIDEVVELWKKDLSTVSESAANALACPSKNPDRFPDMEIALQVERLVASRRLHMIAAKLGRTTHTNPYCSLPLYSMFLQQRSASSGSGISALDYATAKDDLELNLIELIKAQQGGGIPSAPAAVAVVADETKSSDPADEMDEDGNDDDAEALEAARAAAQAALQEEADRIAAEEAARAAAEAEAAAASAREAAEAEAAAARAAAEAQAAAAAAAASTATKIEGDHDPSDFGDDW